MRSPLKIFALLLAVAFCHNISAQNPAPTGNLYGQVFDEQGQILSRVAATLTGPAATRTTSADARGEFHFLNLPPGAYVVTLEQPGFATVRRQVAVFLGQDAVISLTMAIAAAKEAVTVSAESPAIDSRKVETGVTFSQKELQSIPTSRDPWNILQQVPGVLLDMVNVGGSQSATEPAFVGKGSHKDQNSWVLDGVTITDMASPGGTPVFFDFDSFEEIQVTTGGSDFSLQTPGVALNLVTKRGTNAVKGSARVFYTSDRFESNSQNAEARSEGLKTDRTDYVRDYGLEAGGPIVKDRLWIWGAADQNDTSLNRTAIILANGQTVHEKPSLRIWTAKIDAQPSSADSLSLYYQHANKTFAARGAGPDRPPETTFDLTAPTPILKIEDSHVFGAQFVASANASYVGLRFTDTPEGGLDKQVELDANGVWRNSWLLFKTHRPQHQAGATASAFFDTGRIAHELKFGFGYKHTVTESFTAWPGDGIVADEYDGLAELTRDGNGKFQMNYYDAYLGDTATAGSLTLNAGVRFDYQQGRNLPSSVAANPVFPDLLPAVHYAGDSGYPITWRTFEPRVSATYALGKEKKTLLRASYAEFANQLGPEVFQTNAFPSAQYLYYYWSDTNGDHHVDRNEVDLSDGLVAFYGLDPNNPGAPTPVNRISKNLTAPTTDEIILGIDRQLGSDLAASLAYTYRSNRNQEFSPLLGTDAGSYTFLGYASGTATGANGFALNFREPYYGLTTRPPPVGVAIANRPDYRETYNGLEIQVVKRLSHGWMFRGGFAYNDWRRHLGSSAIVDPNNLVGGINADGSLVAEPSGGGQRTPFVFLNSRWQFNLSGLYQLPAGFQVSANFFGREGFVAPYFVQVKTHDTRDNQPLIQIGSVDDYRLGNVYELDLSLEKAFRIGSRITLTPSVDCFNALDRTTVLQRNLNVGTYDARKTPAFKPNPFFNTIYETQSPTIFRAGLRVAF
jgi:Carboxypeptidase regulatory-like domain/TonB-dependent Receptor Plug Domain